MVPPWADLDGKGPGPNPPPRRFKSYRASLKKYSSSGDPQDLRAAAGHYARVSIGGDAGETGARRLQPAIRVGAALAHALADVASGGTGEQALGFNLRALSGQDSDTVIAAVINALAPSGGPPDENEIREGLVEALAVCVDTDSGFDPDDLNVDMIAELLQEFVVEEIYQRMLADAQGALTASGSPTEILKKEQALRSMIDGQVDITAGAILRGLNLNFTKGAFEEMLREIIRRVWAEFEAYKA